MLLQIVEPGPAGKLKVVRNATGTIASRSSSQAGAVCKTEHPIASARHNDTERFTQARLAIGCKHLTARNQVVIVGHIRSSIVREKMTLTQRQHL